MSKPRYIMVNDELVAYDDACVHLLSPTVKYGALVFEGLRAYWNAEKEQLYVFRLNDHFKRFHHTLKAVRFDARYETARLVAIVKEVLEANEIRDDVHMRVSAYLEGGGLYDATGPVSLMCAAYARRSSPIEEKVLKAGVVSWRRIDDASMPPRLKVAANYHNARLGILEARANGYDEAIFLTASGKITEGPGSCLLIVRDGVLVSPTVTDGILESVTRATVLDLAHELGIPTQERPVDRTELYFAEEAFFCGTGVEIQPVSEVDRLVIGDGKIGKITRKIWMAYEDLVRGRSETHQAWLTSVY